MSIGSIRPCGVCTSMRPNRATSSSERCFRDAGRFNGIWELLPCGIGDCFVPIMESAAIDVAEWGEETSAAGFVGWAAGFAVISIPTVSAVVGDMAAADPRTGTAEQIDRNNAEISTLTRTHHCGNRRVPSADGISVL